MLFSLSKTASLALAATTFIASTSALPMRASTSRIARRSHHARHASAASELEVSQSAAVEPVSSPASHNIRIDGAVTGSTINVNFNSKSRRRSPVSTGDHSILVDASASPDGSKNGGINASMINLTVISRRAANIISRWIGKRSASTPTAVPVGVDRRIALAERKAIRNALRKANEQALAIDEKPPLTLTLTVKVPDELESSSSIPFASIDTSLLSTGDSVITSSTAPVSSTSSSMVRIARTTSSRSYATSPPPSTHTADAQRFGKRTMPRHTLL